MRRLDQFRDWLYKGQKFGAAELVIKDARAHYQSVVEDIAAQLCDGARTVQDAIDIYYLRVRMRRWWGTMMEIDRENRVLPLFSAPAIAAAFALPEGWRQAQFLPYFLMAAADRRLVTTPFASDVWPTALHELVGDASLTADLVASAENPVSGTGGVDPSTGALRPVKRNLITENLAQRAPRQVEELCSLVIADVSNPLFDVLDREALRQAADAFTELPHQTKQIVFGALGAGLWLGHHEEQLYCAGAS
jgi:hypothetical protein